jgi:hypothetical protein
VIFVWKGFAHARRGPPPAEGSPWLAAAALDRKSARLAAGKAGVYCRCADGRGPTTFIGWDTARDREVYATTRIAAGTLLATGVIERVVPLAEAEVAGGVYGFPGEGGGVAVLRHRRGALYRAYQLARRRRARQLRAAARAAAAARGRRRARVGDQGRLARAGSARADAGLWPPSRRAPQRRRQSSCARNTPPPRARHPLRAATRAAAM